MRYIIAMATLVLISGCGQTGPLYLPDTVPAEAPENAPQAAPENATP